MNGQEKVITIFLGIISSLVAGGILWFFRQQVRELMTALDMSTGALLGWLMAFIMLAVIIVFPLIDTPVPGTLTGIFAVLVVLASKHNCLAATLTP